MNGERDLSILLSSMAPSLDPERYVFCTISQRAIPDNVEIKGCFEESEGMTIILAKHHADAHNFEYSSVLRCITLTVHSSLDAVGLTAAVATQLGAVNISANVVAAYYHDHIFVGEADAQRAIGALISLAKRSATK